jgi:hypothetical protein
MGFVLGQRFFTSSSFITDEKLMMVVDYFRYQVFLSPVCQIAFLPKSFTRWRWWRHLCLFAVRNSIRQMINAVVLRRPFFKYIL